jgi:hypothetical protein
LQETLKHTPEGHPDHADLKLAMGKVSEVVDRINERTRVVKWVMDLKAIQKKLITSQVYSWNSFQIIFLITFLNNI